MTPSLRHATLGALLASAPLAPALAQHNPPQWTHGATCYEVFIRSFQDSNGDGIGDINGLISRLDYINDGHPNSTTSLGARCVWLMPVMESPSYHGYDITDYYKVNHEYGTNDDFRRLMSEAHRRGIHVLVDMVLNHSSSEHPYFQAALHDTASPYRSWYRFSATEPKERPPMGSPAWHRSPVRDEYYYGAFGRDMPDLNYETPAVVAEANRIAKFWLDSMDVDGFRLDAVSYLVEENGVGAHTAGTHRVLHDYEAYVRRVDPDAYTVGEVTFPIDTVLSYYPEQLDSYFAFEVADHLIHAVQTGSARGLLDPVLRLQADVPAARWSPFLRNHDQPRTRTELGGDMAKARVASFLLLTMPGVPFVYYGEEIGMVGGKPDPRIRTPMQWSGRAAHPFTTGHAWEQSQPDSATVTVESQLKDPHSILWLHRALVHLRSTNTALADGELIPLETGNDAVAAYLRRDGDRMVLAIANLSAKPVDGVTLRASADAFPPGRWTMRPIFGPGASATLNVPQSGALDASIAYQRLAPLEGYLFELERALTR